MTMINTMTIDGNDAVIEFGPDINMFRGEFIGLNGGADFYAESVAGLEKEGRRSLKVYLDMCRERGTGDPTGRCSRRLGRELAQHAGCL